MRLKLLIASALLVGSVSAVAAEKSELYVIEGQELLSVSQLLADEEDIQAVYGFENFCYKGSSFTVLEKIQDYKNGGNFFSGGGGGFEYLEGEVLRGIVSYDLQLKFKDEVADGEYKIVIVKPCSLI